MQRPTQPTAPVNTKPILKANINATYYVAKFNTSYKIDLTDKKRWTEPFEMYKEPVEVQEEEQPKPKKNRRYGKHREHSHRDEKEPDVWVLQDACSSSCFQVTEEPQTFKYALLIEHEKCFRYHDIKDWFVCRPITKEPRPAATSAEEAKVLMERQRDKDEKTTLRPKNFVKEEESDKKKKKSSVPESMDYDEAPSDDEGTDNLLLYEEEDSSKKKDIKKIGEEDEEDEEPEDDEEKKPTEFQKPRPVKKRPLEKVTTPTSKKSKTDIQLTEECVVSVLQEYSGSMPDTDLIRIFKNACKAYPGGAKSGREEFKRLVGQVAKVVLVKGSDGDHRIIQLNPEYQ